MRWALKPKLVWSCPFCCQVSWYFPINCSFWSVLKMPLGSESGQEQIQWHFPMWVIKCWVLGTIDGTYEYWSSQLFIYGGLCIHLAGRVSIFWIWYCYSWISIIHMLLADCWMYLIIIRTSWPAPKVLNTHIIHYWVLPKSMLTCIPISLVFFFYSLTLKSFLSHACVVITLHVWTLKKSKSECICLNELHVYHISTI